MSTKKSEFGPGLAAILARKGEPQRIEKIGARKKPEEQVPRLSHPVFAEARAAVIQAGRQSRQAHGDDLGALKIDTRSKKQEKDAK